MGFFPEKSIFDRSSAEWSKLLFDDREMCSIDAPIGYSIGLYSTHLFATPIYFVAFYTLYMERSKNFKFYKRYLAIHAICNLLFEVHLSIMMKPVLYLPYLVIRFAGVSFLRYINGGITFNIFIFIIIGTLWSIMELFYYRFQSMVDSNLVAEWVKTYAFYARLARWVTVVLTVAVVSTLSISVVGLFDQTEHKQKLEIISKYPEILCNSALILPKSDETGIKPIHLFNLSCFLAGIVGVNLGCSLCAVSLLALRHMVRQSRSSVRTMKMHRTFLISLVGQISVHALMLGFPLSVYIIAAAFDAGGNNVGYVAIVMASLHGTMSTLAMILMNKPLLQIVISIFSSVRITATRDSSVIISVV